MTDFPLSLFLTFHFCTFVVVLFVLVLLYCVSVCVSLSARVSMCVSVCVCMCVHVCVCVWQAAWPEMTRYIALISTAFFCRLNHLVHGHSRMVKDQSAINFPALIRVHRFAWECPCVCVCVCVCVSQCLCLYLCLSVFVCGWLTFRCGRFVGGSSAARDNALTPYDVQGPP